MIIIEVASKYMINNDNNSKVSYLNFTIWSREKPTRQRLRIST